MCQPLPEVCPEDEGTAERPGPRQILHRQDLPVESAGYIRIIIAGLLITMLYDILIASVRAIGDTVTPLISSGIEMAGKIILAFTLVPALGYFGVILVEPIVWIVMIIPPILKVRTWER